MVTDENKLFLSNIDRIIVPLGLKCNLNCRHCIQNSNKMYGYTYNEDFISDGFIEALVCWSNVCKSRERKIFSKPTIIFYGGEPLLYFKRIKDIILKLEQTSFDFTKIDFKIFSNIILLNDEMVSFFNQYEFKVGLSADGADLKFVRNDFPSDQQIDLWKNIKNRFVVCTIMAGNPDFVKNIIFLKRKFDVLVVDVELLCVGWDMDKDIFDFKLADIDESFKRIILYYSSHPLDDAFYSFFRNFFPDLILGGEYNSFTMDTSGAIGAGRFLNAPLGYVTDDLLNLKNRSKELFSARVSLKCKNCRYNNHCYTKDYLGDLRYKDIPGYYCSYVGYFSDMVDKYKVDLVFLLGRN